MPVLPILLVLASLAFFILEVFIVSFGALTVVGVSLGVAGVVFAFQYSALYGWSLLAVMLVGIPAALKTAFVLLPKIPFARGFFLKPPTRHAKERNAAAPALDDLVGDTGTATSPLRPSGRAEFAGRPVDVVTRGRMVERGARVRVVDVHGNRVVVEPLDEGDPPDA